MATKNDPKCSNCIYECDKIFSTLGKNQIGDFEQIQRHFTYKSGQMIPLEIAGRQGFFYIQSGYAIVSVKRGSSMKALHISGPGSMIGFGHWAFESPIFTSALEECTVCFFDKELFLLLQDKNPEVSRVLVNYLCSLISTKNDTIATLKERSVRQRVASTLLNLEKKFGKSTKLKTVINIQMNRKVLADLSGTVIETLARVLTELENDGIIKRDGKSFHILNRQKLVEHST